MQTFSVAVLVQELINPTKTSKHWLHTDYYAMYSILNWLFCFEYQEDIGSVAFLLSIAKWQKMPNFQQLLHRNKEKHFKVLIRF